LCWPLIVIPLHLQGERFIQRSHSISYTSKLIPPLLYLKISKQAREFFSFAPKRAIIAKAQFLLCK